jgi:hypothetical protein
MMNKSHLINSEVKDFECKDGGLVLIAALNIAKGDYITDCGLTMTTECSAANMVNSTIMATVS